MARPSPRTRAIQGVLVQRTAAVSLHRIQYVFRLAICRSYDMYMIRANVGSQEDIATAGTDLDQALQYKLPANFVQQVGLLGHSGPGAQFFANVRLWNRCAEAVLCA